MDIDNALRFLDELSNDTARLHLESHSYFPSHRALMRLASRVDDDPQNDGLLSLSCAVYGWMPTILKNWKFENFGVEFPVEVVKGLNDAEAGKEFLSKIDAVSPINNSWVGLSKLLYFLNPELFPIWDSRIAKHFGFNWAGQLNRKDVYISYFMFIHENLKAQQDMLIFVADQIEKDHGYRPSAVRCLELIFFESPVNDRLPH
ncbi:hypothetical protein [Sulfitobacter sp.]|uniref:hypothetical protein n=1 Tax=Sulfitobacter sp. TaxID=1903071 RepID=UPI0030028C76